MNSTWEDRDLPVLAAIVELTEEGEDYIELDQLADRTGFDDATVRRAVFALADEQPPFFRYADATTFGGRDIGAVSNPTGYARRTVGAWPTADALADRIVQGLERAAEAETDQERQGWLRKAAAWFGTAGRGVLVEVAGSAVSRGVGLG